MERKDIKKESEDINKNNSKQNLDKKQEPDDNQNIEKEDLTKKKNKRALLAILIFLVFLDLVGLFIPGNKTEEIKKDNQTSTPTTIEETTIEKDEEKTEKEVEEEKETETAEEDESQSTEQTQKQEYSDVMEGLECNILDSIPYREKDIQERYTKIPVNSKIAELYYYLIDYTSDKSREDGIKSFSDAEILELAFKYADYNTNNLTCLKSRALHGMIQEYDILLKDSAYENSLKKIFGSETKVDFNLPVGKKIYTKDSAKLSEIKILASSIEVNSYDAGTKEYSIKASNYSPGSTGRPGEKHKYINQVENNGVITFTKKTIYYELYPGKTNTVGVYADKSLKNQIGFVQIANSNNYDIDIEPFLDKAKTINYTFKLDKTTNKYYFVSSIIE